MNLAANHSQRPHNGGAFGIGKSALVTGRNFRVAVLLAALFALPWIARAEPPVAIDPAQNFGRWEGWGTSLCWWAKELGDRDDLADVFFTMRTVPIAGQPLPGLDLTFVR